MSIATKSTKTDEPTNGSPAPSTESETVQILRKLLACQEMAIVELRYIRAAQYRARHTELLGPPNFGGYPRQPNGELPAWVDPSLVTEAPPRKSRAELTAERSALARRIDWLNESIRRHETEFSTRQREADRLQPLTPGEIEIFVAKAGGRRDHDIAHTASIKVGIERENERRAEQRAAVLGLATAAAEALENTRIQMETALTNLAAFDAEHAAS